MMVQQIIQKKVLAQYRNENNIHIIDQDNKGFSGARNAGIDFATGRYLMFLDSDDEMIMNGIDALLNRAFECDADIVEGGFRYIYIQMVIILISHVLMK